MAAFENYDRRVSTRCSPSGFPKADLDVRVKQAVKLFAQVCIYAGLAGFWIAFSWLVERKRYFVTHDSERRTVLRMKHYVLEVHICLLKYAIELYCCIHTR